MTQQLGQCWEKCVSDMGIAIPPVLNGHFLSSPEDNLPEVEYCFIGNYRFSHMYLP